MVAVSRGDLRRRRDVGNQNGGMSLNRRPVAELTVVIITPAIHLAADLDAHATEHDTHRARFENPIARVFRSPAARPRRARRPSLTARVSRAARVAIGSSRTDCRARESGDGARATRRDGENSKPDAGVRVRVDAPSTRRV